ncbi:TIGR03943 family putative permease subunit [Paenibacillus thailandensis]|uniref:TIGR03943 family putative permease subunit n=1 Tax=Paenibacillus thailandensis TaxID=393250 RepID=A0ABW5R4S9_9BACL
MSPGRSPVIHYLLRAAILASFSFLIARFVRADKLYYYIAPRMETIVKLAALGLFAVAVFQAYLALQAYFDRKERAALPSCECGHHPPASKRKNAVLYGLFALPLALGFLTPDTLLGSGLTAIKGVNLSSSASVRPAEANDSGLAAQPQAAEAAGGLKPPSGAAANAPSGDVSSGNGAAPNGAGETDDLDALFPYDSYTELHARLAKRLYKQDVIDIPEIGFMEALTTLDLYKNAFVGKEVAISGYVYREEGMKPDQFVVSRLAMQCCSADTEPYGILASSEKASALDDDTWVRVKGEIALTKYMGMEIMDLRIGELTVIDPPDSPYVYPNDDYFELLLNELPE